MMEQGKGRVLPELIPGPRAGLGWVVRECQAMKSVVGLDPTTQSIAVPERVLRQDWLVQQHELTHVSEIDIMWPAPKDRHVRRMFRMLCEVAVEARSLHRNGIDIRTARDHLDWTQLPPPDDDDTTGWAHMWLQLTMSADVSQHPAVSHLYQRACDILGDERVGWLVQARDAVVMDLDSRATRLRWAAWLGDCFPRAEDTPPPPPTPPPPSGDDGEDTGNDGESDDGEESDDGGPSAPENESDGEDSPGNDGESEEGEDDGESDDSGESGDDSGESEGEQGESDDDGEEAGNTEGDDSGDDSDQGDDGGVETTTADDDDWASPAEQVVERAGARRVRRGQEQEARARQDKEDLQRAIDAAWNPDAEHGVWIVDGAKIDIHRHTATRVARKLPGRGGARPSDNGPRLAYARRLYQDGRVLARTGRTGGGILVDGSGSMAWSQSTVDQAVAVLPGLWVGWYSLHQSALALYTQRDGRAEEHSGGVAGAYERLRRAAPYWARLCVIAEKGRVAEYRPGAESMYHSGGNEVDADCLAYFARACQGPRIWVSDGQVYGAPGHAAQCTRIMRQYNIVRVLTVDEAVRYLEGKPVMGYRDCSATARRIVR